ncbi:MAG: aldo/keto reductase, partial [Candidatus Kapaibacterium sp.]
MSTRQIGTTGIFVNEIGYGAMHLSIDPLKRPAEADAIALIQRGVDELGLDFIDTADAYCANDGETGHNERLIAKALKGERRGRVTVATKGGCIRPEGSWERSGRPEHLRAACEASLRALETERIELYQLHAPDPNVPV